MTSFTPPVPPPALVPELITYRDRLAMFVGHLSELIATLSSHSEMPPQRSTAAYDTKTEGIPSVELLREEVKKPVRKPRKASRDPEPAPRRQRSSEDQQALFQAVAAQDDEFRNVDLMQYLAKHHPEFAKRLERSTGRLSIFITQLKERGWVEFVRKDGNAVYNRKTPAFQVPAGDSVQRWESFKFGTLGMKPQTPSEE